MIMARFPQTVYMTRRCFNDYMSDDMRYGDMTEYQLKNKLGLSYISNIVDPWTLTRFTAFDNPQSRFSGVYGNRSIEKTLSVKECAGLLFSEMQVTSLPYAFVGQYKYLINRMLRHFQQSTGSSFRDIQLNEAYSHQINNDNSQNSTRLAIQQEINDHMDYKLQGYPQSRIPELTKIISSRILPKFDSLIMDKINGMGITIHDVHATKIDICSLVVRGNRWQAKVKYTGQDHFGLDVDDISKKKFNQFQFFKIWFILQRYNRFGFRPFFTELDATIDIEGGQ